MSKVGAVLVIGGGIAGMQTSLDLADSGYKVYLVETLSAIGGIMAQLDKTFPTNDCAMCIVSPKLVATGRHPNIQIIPYADVDKVSGEAGNFTVTIKKKASYIDNSQCTGCGTCSTLCPIEILNDYDANLRIKSCISVRYPQAIPKVSQIEKDYCLGCGLCNQLCEANAVKYDQQAEFIDLNVGAIILAPGAKTFDPTMKKALGYDRLPNVVTSLEFERILSASGPFDGHVLRPSDGIAPRKIAWLQCVGSRDISIGHDFCSSVCCMYAIKEAIIAREHDSRIEPTLFYMDIRAFGKGFEKYYVNAEKINGVRFIKTRVPLVKPAGDQLLIRYQNENQDIVEEKFDMVVLSVGFECTEDYQKYKEIFGIELNRFNYCETQKLNPVETSRKGIYVVGTFRTPKDIPDTVAEASGAASSAGALLSTERNTLITPVEYPPEIDVSDQEPRIGAFICHCGINIGSIVDVPAVVEYAKTLPNVVYAERNLYTCSQDTQDKIKELIKEHNLNRVVVASCTPRTHEPLFQNTIRTAGLNFYLFSMANIREHVSWVHRADPQTATEKAKDLVAMAVAKARLQEPLYNFTLDMIKACFIIGGGIAGMTAALEIANQGFQAYLIERSADLGGLANKIKIFSDTENLQDHITNLKNEINKNEKIKVFLNAEIKEIGGSIGNFHAKIGSNGQTEEIQAGTVIIATGGSEYSPVEYNYGKDDHVITQFEFEEKILENKLTSAKTVVIIQCVGSRNEERNYCSRVCCTVALKNAIEAKKRNPALNIFILYRDIRSYGFREEYYQKAREMGIRFIRFIPERQPTLDYKDDKMVIWVYDEVFKRKWALHPDFLVLTAAIVPNVDDNLTTQLKLPLDEFKFFLEAHTKLRPIDFSSDGIFLCGLAHSPKFIDETIIQAKGAVSRACTFLSKDEIELEGIKPRINPDVCVGCGICVDVCPFDALELKVVGGKKISVVSPMKCHGCGACAAACPRGASELVHFNDSEIISQLVSIAAKR